MTPEDKREIRELIQDLLTAKNAKIEANYDNLEYKIDNVELILGEIKTQTTKTNGRVTALELKDASHITNCPHAPKLNDRVRALEDNQLSVKSVKTWVISSVTIASLVVGILFVFFKVITGL